METVENWELSAREFLFRLHKTGQKEHYLHYSPSAIKLQFERQYAVVDNRLIIFMIILLLKADGKKLKEDFSTTLRSNLNEFGLALKNTADGIYFVRLS